MIRPPPRSPLFPSTTLSRSAPPAVEALDSLLIDVETADTKAGCASGERKRQADVTETDKDRKSTRLNSSHQIISYAVFCLKKKKKNTIELCKKSTIFGHIW